ncbi:polymorphic toxin-type HINT domain-containing protein [Actinomadura luteofluorescens]|uniref:polymorphic toxin-type HINT domain-containing protein n=1 Tax=Actinomadura luteofluorescens TaxID=46163 RepID=UPI003641B7E0
MVSYHQNTPTDQQTLLGGFKAGLTGAAIDAGLAVSGLLAAKAAAPVLRRVAPKIVQKVVGRAKGGAPGHAGSAAKTVPAAAKKAGKAAADAPVAGGGGGGCLRRNSFVAGTSVLMADGSAKLIDKVKVGDKVLATDLTSGRRSAQTVQATIAGTGMKRLVQITVDTDGNRGDQTAELIATDGHPLWVPTADKWIDAGKLRPGMSLRTPAATRAQIIAVKPHVAYQRVHNLTVEIDHTYYVLAGKLPLLVHNCGPDSPIDLGEHVRNDVRNSAPNSNQSAAVARDGYTGETAYGESGSGVPENVNHLLLPRLQEALGLVGTREAPEAGWGPGVCAEFHACNAVLNENPGTRLEDLEYFTVNKVDLTPKPSCGWCQMLLADAREATN